MRIGIITQPLHTNYGGLLQNYALQQVLRKFGHEVYTINRTYPRDIYTLPATKQIKFLAKQTIKKFLGKTYSPTKNDISRIKWNYKTYNAGERWGIFNKDVDFFR